MKIIFDRRPGRIKDVFDSLYLMCNKNYEKFADKYNIDFNKQVSETIKYLDENAGFDWSNFKFMFDDSLEYIDAVMNTEDMWNIKEEKDIVGFVKSIDSCLTRDKIIKYMIRRCNMKEDEWDFSKTDYVKMTNLIEKMDITQELKWQTFCFMQNPKYYLDMLSKSIEDYLKIYDIVMSRNKDIIENFSDKAEKEVNEKGVEYIEDFAKSIINHTDNVYLTTAFFNSYNYEFHSFKDKVCLFVGIDYEKTVEALGGQAGIDRNLKVLKNLSDNSRFQIVNLLKNGECYGQEIADKVGISTATLNYHIQFLLVSGIVKIEREEGRKTYFSLNKEPIKNCIKFLQQTLNISRLD